MTELELHTDDPTEGGVKHDNGKPDLSLLPYPALEELSRAMMFGAKKYGRNNYRKGMAWTRLLGACLRHVTAFSFGEDKDPESGLSHLAHAGACILFLLTYEKLKLGKDDR